MFLLLPAYSGCPGQTAVKWLLLLLSFIYRRKRQHQQQKCDDDQPKVPLPGVISSVYEDIECMNNQKNEATYEEIEYENKKNNDTYEHPNFEPAHSPYGGDVEHVYQARCVD